LWTSQKELYQVADKDFTKPKNETFKYLLDHHPFINLPIKAM